MNFAEITRQLTMGELSQLGIATQLKDFSTFDRITPFVDSVNLALTAIYKRFNLKEGRLSFPLDKEIQVYPISEPSILKIERVLTESEECVPLNDTSDEYSCFTPSSKTLRVPQKIVLQAPDLPEKYKTTGLTLVYRANHPKLNPKEVFSLGMENVELELPDAYLQALLYFVASRFHNPVGMTNEFHAGNSFFAKYQAECATLENENLETDQGPSNTRLYRAGFV